VFSMKNFYDFLDKISTPLGVTEIVLGFVLCFLGRVMIKPALFMIGLITGTLSICLMYFMLIFKATTPNWWVWVVFGFGIILGIVLGIIFFQSKKVASAILAAYTGFSIGKIMFGLMPFHYKHYRVAKWCTIGPMMILLILLAIRNTDRHYILNSAFFGAFILIMGIGHFSSHYPDSWDPFALIPENGNIWDIDPYFWLYGGSLLLLFFTGFIIQCLTLKYERK